jgi:hypothetical protein
VTTDNRHSDVQVAQAEMKTSITDQLLRNSRFKVKTFNGRDTQSQQSAQPRIAAHRHGQLTSAVIACHH